MTTTPDDAVTENEARVEHYEDGQRQAEAKHVVHDVGVDGGVEVTLPERGRVESHT